MHQYDYAELRLRFFDIGKWEILANGMGVFRLRRWMDLNLIEKGHCYFYSVYEKRVISSLNILFIFIIIKD